MSFKPLDLPERFVLFPDACKLANLVLKKLRFMTASEQSAAGVRAMYHGIELLVKEPSSAENIRAINFYANQQGKYKDVNPLRDLNELQDIEKIDVRGALHDVKKSYNELVSVCLRENPQFIDFAWQVYRRTHKKIIDEHKLARMINPLEEPRMLVRSVRILPISKKDEERIAYYESELGFSRSDDLLKEEPFRRLVEFDENYFYGTGRFAFASENGDIFQTIWDERQEEFPLFNLD